MEEEWRDLPGFEGFYMVSNLGKIKSKVGRWRPAEHILKDFNIGSGYRYVTLSVNSHRKNILVHRAVAIAFVDGYFDGAEVNHLDGNKHNNRANNLEWTTHKANIWHASDELGVVRGHGHKVIMNIDTGQCYESIAAAAKAAGCSRTQMGRGIYNGKIINGYRWGLAPACKLS